MIRLKWERVRRDWTQQELAEKARVPKTDICRFEKGRSIPFKPQLQRLSDVLEVPEDELLQEYDPLGKGAP